MSTDLLSNMVSSLKNASLVGNSSIEIPYAKQCEDVAKVLQKEGFLAGVKSFKGEGKIHKGLHLDLAFENGVAVLREEKRVSKPGRRIYRKSGVLYAIKGGMGLLVVSTSRGVMPGAEAKRKKLGGELICEVF